MPKQLHSFMIAIVLALTASHLRADPVRNDNAAWEQFADRLIQQITGKADWDNTQIVTIPIDARWNDPTYGNYYAWVEIGNKIPVWGPTYRASDKFVDQEYQQFIGSLDLPLADPSQKKKANKAQKEYLDAKKSTFALRKKIGSDWKSFHESEAGIPVNRQTSYDQWLADNDGAKLAGLIQAEQAAALDYSHYFQQAFKGYAFAGTLLTEFDNSAYQISAKSPDGLELKYRTYNISPDLNSWIDSSKKIPEGAPPVFSFTFNRNAGHTHVEDTHFSGGGSYFGGFLGIGGNGGYTKHTVDTTRDGFVLSFSAKNLGQFSVTPGKWFSATAISTFKDGPFVKDAVIKSPKDLWGKDGRFNLMTTTLIVAYQPKVVAALSSSEYHELKEAYNGGFNISIGPFGFGASYQRNIEDVKFDDATNTVTATNLSETPQIIAVVSSELPDFKK
ncbi:MAG: hypothetical protein ACXVNF_06320 [Neobacillus sp.]